MLAHLYLQQQLLREHSESLIRMAAAQHRRPDAASSVFASQLQRATRSVGARLLGIPAPAPLQHGC